MQNRTSTIWWCSCLLLLFSCYHKPLNILLQIAAAHKNSSQPAVTSTGNSLISGLLCCCLPHIFYWFLPVQCIDMMLECEKRRDCCGDRTTEDERESASVLVVEKRFTACRYVQFSMWSERVNLVHRLCVFVCVCVCLSIKWTFLAVI